MNPAAINANPLDQLRDIHLPEPISWWPLAPGWWLLIIISLALAAWTTRFVYRRYRAALYRRQALKKLNQLTELNNQQQLTGLYELLKQTANTAYPQLHPASLGAEAFISFLVNSCTREVFQQLDFNLAQALYSDPKQSISYPGNEQLERLLRDARIWIKHHHNHEQLRGQISCCN